MSAGPWQVRGRENRRPARSSLAHVGGGTPADGSLPGNQGQEPAGVRGARIGEGEDGVGLIGVAQGLQERAQRRVVGAPREDDLADTVEMLIEGAQHHPERRWEALDAIAVETENLPGGVAER